MRCGISIASSRIGTTMLKPYYYYTTNDNLSNFNLGEELSDDEMKPITGGKSFFKLFADYNYS